MARNRTADVRTFLSSKAEELFGADIRSLALFRICLGAILLMDLFNRSRDLVTHYTDRGVLPRFALKAYGKDFGSVSFHMLDGSASFQILLFILAAIFALAFLAGYRTRLANFLSWLFLISLHARNPMVLQRGDAILRMALFWSMFVPLGASYSIDRALNRSEKDVPERIFSLGTAGLFLQICFIYYFSVLHKYGAEWMDGSAVYYALQIDQYRRPFGEWLLNFPDFLRWVSFAVYYFELIGSVFLFFPIWNSTVRLILVAGFLFLHAVFGLALSIGLFPWISAAVILCFLPAKFWNAILRRLRTPERAGLTVYYDADCGFCKKSVRMLKTFLLLPETPLRGAQENLAIYADMKKHNSWVVVDYRHKRHVKFEAMKELIRRSMFLGWLPPFLENRLATRLGTRFYETTARHRAFAGSFMRFFKFRPLNVRPTPGGTMAAALFILYVFLWNMDTLPDFHLKLPLSWQRFGYSLGLNQTWSMFAPSPLKNDGWYVIPGRFSDGQVRDLFRRGEVVEWTKPRDVSSSFPNQRWRKYMMNLVKTEWKDYVPYLAAYLCRTWNSEARSEGTLQELEIVFMEEMSLPDNRISVPEKIVLWKGGCFDKK